MGLVVALPPPRSSILTFSRWADRWWLAARPSSSLAMLLIARVAPALLLPLFYASSRSIGRALRARLESLSARAGLPVLGVYEWGLGEKTTRANAALVGAGRGRRILLSDTLLAQLHRRRDRGDPGARVGAPRAPRHQERSRDRALLIVATCAIASRVLAVVAAPLELRGAADRAGLPVVLIVAGAISGLATPALNAWSRRNEHRADRFALQLTERPDAFESAMRRLAAQNLAEERPSATTLWLFHLTRRSTSGSGRPGVAALICRAVRAMLGCQRQRNPPRRLDSRARAGRGLAARLSTEKDPSAVAPRSSTPVSPNGYGRVPTAYLITPAEAGGDAGRSQRTATSADRYCLTSSTRRFFARPGSLSFGATGASGPAPAALSRAGWMPCLPVSSFTTAAARRSDRPMLYS